MRVTTKAKAPVADVNGLQVATMPEGRSSLPIASLVFAGIYVYVTGPGEVDNRPELSANTIIRLRASPFRVDPGGAARAPGPGPCHVGYLKFHPEVHLSRREERSSSKKNRGTGVGLRGLGVRVTLNSEERRKINTFGCECVREVYEGVGYGHHDGHNRRKKEGINNAGTPGHRSASAFLTHRRRRRDGGRSRKDVVSAGCQAVGKDDADIPEPLIASKYFDVLRLFKDVPQLKSCQNIQGILHYRARKVAILAVLGRFEAILAVSGHFASPIAPIPLHIFRSFNLLQSMGDPGLQLG
ncbi:hypothetical protein FB451DRAFT_1182633 [Mycena latifolia]|nr:hypothetical protein FB451DRAFT_1182633 [Mycena latifolia]